MSRLMSVARKDIDMEIDNFDIVDQIMINEEELKRNEGNIY